MVKIYEIWSYFPKGFIDEKEGLMRREYAFSSMSKAKRKFEELKSKSNREYFFVVSELDE